MLSVDVTKKFVTPQGKWSCGARLEIEQGSFNVLYGESGSGKTTILRLMAGLTAPDSGEVSWNGNGWHSGKKCVVKPGHRKIGYVPQDYALFENMTAKDNINFGCRICQEDLNGIIGTAGIAPALGLYPHQLSGGQKQRVSLIRAMASGPEFLFLDEPLSSLDAGSRSAMRAELKAAKESGITVVMATHDMTDIFSLADRVFVIASGKVERNGTPAEIFFRRKFSGKFTITGEIVSLEKFDILYTAVITAGRDIVETILTSAEAEGLKPGDRVLVGSKAFQTAVLKLS